MFKVEVIGNLGADCEVKVDQGYKFATFRVAHTERWQDQEGHEQVQTTWIDCTMNNIESKIIPYLKQGVKVFVRGFGGLRVYSSKKDRCMKAGLTIKVLEVELCGGTSDDVPRQLIEPSSGQLVDITKHYWANIDTKSLKKDDVFELIDRQGNRYQGNKQGFIVPVIEKPDEEVNEQAQ